MKNMRIRCVFALLFLAAVCNAVHAQEELPNWLPLQEDTREHAKHDAGVVDPYTGNLTFAYRDVHLPGNGGLDINVFRSYDMRYTRPTWGPTTYPAPLSSYRWVGLGMGWRVDVAPRVVMYSGVASVSPPQPLSSDEDKICGGASLRGAYVLEHANGTSEPLVGLSPGVAQTASNWRYYCDSKTGPYRLRSPDGVEYQLGLTDTDAGILTTMPGGRPTTVRLTTKVVDPFGNWYTIDYRRYGAGLRVLGSLQLWAAFLPVSINSNDGRSLYFNYEDGVAFGSAGAHPPRLLSIYAAAILLASYVQAPGAQYDFLQKVTRSDGASWLYEYWPSDAGNGPARDRVKSVKGPHGGTTAYDYSSSYYLTCYIFDSAPPLNYTYSNQVAKVSSSNGGVWRYDYVRGRASGEYDVTTVTGPDGTTTHKYYGVGYLLPAGVSMGTIERQCNESQLRSFDPWRLGLLAAKDVNGLSTLRNVWTFRVLSTDWHQFVLAYARIQTDPVKTYRVPVLQQTALTVDGVLHTKVFQQVDAFGNPGIILEGVNSSVRARQFSYVNDEINWIIGRRASESVSLDWPVGPGWPQ